MKIGDYVWKYTIEDRRPIQVVDICDGRLLAMGASIPIEGAVLVTVADAFALAGHPVPEGAVAYKESTTWFYQFTGGDNDRVWRFEDGWHLHPSFRRYRGFIGLSRLPVADCLDSLPQIVKEALK